MSISRRRLLGTGGGLAVAGVTGAGCGSNTGRGGDGKGGKPTLSQWYHQYGEPGTEQAVKRYADAFDDARVEVQWRPGNYDQQTAAALLTTSGPDVFEVNGPTLDQIRGGQVVDLTDLLKEAKDDINPAVLAPKTYEGKVWAIPQVVDTQLLYYRTSMLKDAGVEPPRTLDALVDAAKALTTRDVKGLFLGNALTSVFAGKSPTGIVKAAELLALVLVAYASKADPICGPARHRASLRSRWSARRSFSSPPISRSTASCCRCCRRKANTASG